MVPQSSPQGINAIKSYVRLGKQYTLASFNSNGFLEQRCFVLSNISYKPYKHYCNPCLLILKGNVLDIKWDKFIRLHEHKQSVLWEGYHKVNTAVMVQRGILDIGSGHSIAEKRWPALDPRYLVRAKSFIKVEPVAEYLEPLQPEVLLNFQCISERN